MARYIFPSFGFSIKFELSYICSNINIEHQASQPMPFSTTRCTVVNTERGGCKFSGRSINVDEVYEFKRGLASAGLSVVEVSGIDRDDFYRLGSRTTSDYV